MNTRNYVVSLPLNLEAEWILRTLQMLFGVKGRTRVANLSLYLNKPFRQSKMRLGRAACSVKWLPWIFY